MSEKTLGLRVLGQRKLSPTDRDIWQLYAFETSGRKKNTTPSVDFLSIFTTFSVYIHILINPSSFTLGIKIARHYAASSQLKNASFAPLIHFPLL